MVTKTSKLQMFVDLHSWTPFSITRTWKQFFCVHKWDKVDKINMLDAPKNEGGKQLQIRACVHCSLMQHQLIKTPKVLFP